MADQQDICKTFDLPQAELKYYPDFISAEDAKLYFEEFTELPFAQGYVHGCRERRRSCFFGIPDDYKLDLTCAPNKGTEYWYAGKSNTALMPTPSLVFLRDQIEEVTGVRCNAILANYYADGNQVIGWHSDSEASLIPGSTIASLSLGAERFFDVMPIPWADLRLGADIVLTAEETAALRTAPRLRLSLASGSLLTMGGRMQKFYKHQVPTQKTIREPRINLTFRQQKLTK